MKLGGGFTGSLPLTTNPGFSGIRNLRTKPRIDSPMDQIFVRTCRSWHSAAQPQPKRRCANTQKILPKMRDLEEQHREGGIWPIVPLALSSRLRVFA
jgi:hypothetical protein